MEDFVTSRGGRLWTTASGDGVWVLFCNGGPGCADYLGPVARMIEDNARVIRFEPSGCGRSDENPPYDVDAMLVDIESVRVHYGVDRWIVAGHSFGADLGLIYALRYPERVIGVICLSGGRFHNDREWHRVYDERRSEEVLPEFAFPPNMEVCRQGNRSARVYLQRPTLWKELSLLKTRALFLYGDRDIRPSWCVEQVASVMPNACFVMIEGADHHIWTTHAGVLAGELTGFVRSLEGDGHRV